MKNLIKKIIYQIFFFSFLIIITEVIFGYWFKSDGFGSTIRNGRLKNQLYEVKYNGIKAGEATLEETFDEKNANISFNLKSTKIYSTIKRKKCKKTNQRSVRNITMYAPLESLEHLKPT